MNEKLSRRIREAEDEVAGEQLDANIEAHRHAGRDRALMLVGGFNAASKIAQVINSELMRGLEIFQEERIWAALGFANMVDFLNSERSPMSKAQYYERKALLEKEGDPLFDLYGEIGLSARKRKLIGKGSVELEGETVIVKTDDQETTIDLSDRNRILETISALADANADKSHKLDKQQKKIDGHRTKVEELYSEIDTIRAAKAADLGQDPHSVAVIHLNFSFRELIDTVCDMTPIEREQFVARDFELIAERMTELAAAYGRSDWTKIAPATAAAAADDIDAVIASALEEDNDASLAAKL
jgi:hypothetical protein